MRELEQWIGQYLEACEVQRGLDPKTRKAYRIDLTQVAAFLSEAGAALDRDGVVAYVAQLHHEFRPRTIKRKVASLKAFCAYLEYEELILENPFTKIRLKLATPFLLPRAIPLHTIEAILSAAYRLRDESQTPAQQRVALRDIAVLELLFAVGLRVSELCALKAGDVDLESRELMIYGKGAKERLLQIENPSVLAALSVYRESHWTWIQASDAFFVNRSHGRLSDQSVRHLVDKYANRAGVGHITPHMFRHSFATLLLEEDVDIRYIQNLLGHSSITTTQIYTHISAAKQRNILSTRHPRNKISL